MDTPVTDQQKIVAAITKLLGRDVPMAPTSRLNEELGLDSASLIELTVIVHALYGVDLGRRAVEHKMFPSTVGDLIVLLGKP